MRLPVRISTRLFLAVLATAVLMVGLVGGITRWNFERGFLGYLNELGDERMAYVQPRLEEAYAAKGSWEFLREEPRRWFHLLRPVPGQELPLDADPRRGSMMLPSDLTGAMPRMGLLDAQNQWVAGYREITPAMNKRALHHEERIVGWLVLAPFQAVADGAENRFERGQDRGLMVAIVAALVLAALVAWWVSRTLLAPVQRVARATHRLASGDHTVRVPVDTRDAPHDEVAELGRDFNHLALTLERNETLRRGFIADVSHELRTPLSVLKGELEALSDGIRPLNAGAVSSLQDEVDQLGKLIDDLYELALSDAGALSYRMESVDLSELVRRVCATHQGRLASNGLTLEIDDLPSPAWVEADEGRLHQMLDNLLENSRRYTDAPGQVRVHLHESAGHWQLDIEDSAPGVPEAERAQLFERFFRVEGSRNRATGGAGLGLAITRNIVEAHGGRIEALDSPLGGITVSITLPRRRKDKR